MEPPERQTGKEDECRPQVIVPFCLVYVYFHRSEVFSDFGIIKIDADSYLSVVRLLSG
jgi:hypothetical protein